MVTLRTSHPSRSTRTLTTALIGLLGLVDLTGQTPELVELALLDLALRVGVDDEHLVVLQTSSRAGRRSHSPILSACWIDSHMTNITGFASECP